MSQITPIMTHIIIKRQQFCKPPEEISVQKALLLLLIYTLQAILPFDLPLLLFCFHFTNTESSLLCFMCVLHMYLHVGILKQQ